MRRIVTGIVAASFGLLLPSSAAGAQTSPAYPPPTPTTTSVPQASAQVGGVSITRSLEPEPVAVGGVVLTRDVAAPAGNALARTGSDTETLLRAALLAVAVGGAAVLAARRRPAQPPAA